MQRVTRLCWWNGASRGEFVRQFPNVIVDFQQLEQLNDVQAFLCRASVTAPAFINNELRDNNLVFRRNIWPPPSCEPLPRRNQRVRMQPARKMPNDGRLDVNRVHGNTLTKKPATCSIAC